MENATRALTIAAGVLIAMIVVSLIVVGVNRLGSVRKVEQDALSNQELEKFNRNFESYNTDVVSGYKILSLANMADDTNQRYRDVDGYKQVRIYASFLKPVDSEENHEIGLDSITVIDGVDSTSPAMALGNSKELNIGNNKKYYNMIAYVYDRNGQKGPYKSLANDKIMKKFRDRYFTCISTQYDDKSETASGRVILMAFDEIKKKDTT